MSFYQRGVGPTGRPIITNHGNLRLLDRSYGAQHVQHGVNCGASWVHAILGPDIGATNGHYLGNHPTATGGPWDGIFPGGIPRPALGYRHDTTRQWYRGHMLNGNWGGSGNNWGNLVSLTPQANSWHRGLENSINMYLSRISTYDALNKNALSWFGLEIWLIRSLNPFAGPPAASNNLYSYAPSFVYITYRAISLPKIVQTSGTLNVPGILAGRSAASHVDLNTLNPQVYNLPGPLVAQQVGFPLLVATLGMPLIHPGSTHPFNNTIQIHNV